MNNAKLNEGLRPNDLDGMVINVFEIDAFQSKMGDDRDVCVLSFKVKDRDPAKDLMEFIEKGFKFVLDSDVSAGEDREGDYHVFVELRRDFKLAKHINEIADGLSKLTGIKGWQFRYYKSHKNNDLTEDNVKAIVPTDPVEYDSMLENIRVESIEKFFNQTYKEEIIVEGNKVTIKKPFGVKVAFEIVEFGEVGDVQKSITEGVKLDTGSMAEVMWLTKIFGDFNINKYGETFSLEDSKRAMIIKLEK